MWAPNFDGGLDQSFHIQFKKTEDNNFLDQYTSAYSSLHLNQLIEYKIENLKPDTEYYITVLSKNQLGESIGQFDYIKAKTKSWISQEKESKSIYASVNERIWGENGLLWENIFFVVIGAALFLFLFLAFSLFAAINYYRKKKSTKSLKTEQPKSASTPTNLFLISSDDNLHINGICDQWSILNIANQYPNQNSLNIENEKCLHFQSKFDFYCFFSIN